MKVPYSAFECVLYLPRQQITRDWALDACETLWRHGMRLLAPDPVVGDWTEQLSTPPPHQAYATTSLSDQIDDIVRVGSGDIVCYDRNVEFHLLFDLDVRQTALYYSLSPEQLAARERLQFGKLQLSIRYPNIASWQRIKALPTDNIPATAYLIPPYEQAHLAMAHWMEVLCAHLHPAFAVGYYATNSYAASESDIEWDFETYFLKEFDVAVATALESGQFPALSTWLDQKQIYLLYAPAHLMTAATVEAWLATPGRWSRRLPDGAWLAFSMPEAYDVTLYEEYYAAADALLKEIRMSDNRARLPEARAYVQRAQALAPLLQPPKQSVNLLLGQLEYLERQS